MARISNKEKKKKIGFQDKLVLNLFLISQFGIDPAFTVEYCFELFMAIPLVICQYGRLAIDLHHQSGKCQLSIARNVENTFRFSVLYGGVVVIKQETTF